MKSSTSNRSPGVRRRRSRSASAACDREIPADASPAERLALELASQMRRQWEAGAQPGAEEFFARCPELAGDPEAAVDLIYEEYCLRQAAGHDGVEQEILRRFPQWAQPLRVMFECDRQVLRPQRDQPEFPVSGERLGEFDLLDELSRGAHGRVFLAAQTGLADRPVVLKLTPLEGAEHHSLARLQHSNIVPLYSAFDDAGRRLRVLCMPYFGRATLASVLAALADLPLAARTGRHVIESIDRTQEPADTKPAGSARQMLEEVSYAQAVAWIGACLADALHFAHERGVLHLDLKPSNVLLASDGQPMLLDFHLARGPIVPGGMLPENIGGTPPYMPPEQQAAMQCLQDGVPAATAVDGRADVYALGAMLYEALGGRLPIDQGSPPLSHLNPQVSRGLSDIIACCVARRPEDRYAGAGALAEDLRRHLEDRPLIGVRNRSLAERWRKWRRRRPDILRAAALWVLVCGAGALLVASGATHLRDRRHQAEQALRDGQRQMQTGGQIGEAVKTFERGLGLSQRLPLHDSLQQQLRDQLASAKRLQLVHDLHHLADEVRVLYASEIPQARARPLVARCDDFWQKRGAILSTLASPGNPDIDDDLKDIAIFAAVLHDARDALRILDEAADQFGPSAVIEHERRSRGAPPRTATEPRTAWEHYALGRALLTAGDLARAGDHMAAAIKLHPAGRWENFYHGVCAYRSGRHHDAVAAFSVCIGTAPSVAGFYQHRALAYAALGESQLARQDHDHALRLQR